MVRTTVSTGSGFRRSLARSESLEGSVISGDSGLASGVGELREMTPPNH